MVLLVHFYLDYFDCVLVLAILLIDYDIFIIYLIIFYFWFSQQHRQLTDYENKYLY